MTLKTQEFIRRFCLHILPKGFTRIRHYGILSSSWKKEKLPALQKQLGSKKSEEIVVQVAPSKLKKCPSCKVGDLVTLIEFDSRGPPKAYEYLLKISQNSIRNKNKK